MSRNGEIPSFQNGPRFKKRLDAERSEFAADTGMLESAERRLLIVQHSVDRHAAGLDLGCDAAHALNVKSAITLCFAGTLPRQLVSPQAG
jgi:hypothetical protein